MIKVFYGNDEFAIWKAVNKLKTISHQADISGADYVEINANKHKLSEIIGIASIQPFLSERRVVIVQNFFSAMAKTGQNVDGEQIAQKISPQTELILIEYKAANVNTNYLRSFNQIGEVNEFKLPVRRHEIIERIKQIFLENDIETAPPVPGMMFELLGSQMRLIDSEAKKLKVYADDRPITAADVEKLVSSAREARVFEMIDNIMAKNSTKALVGFYRLIEQGDSSTSVITLLVRQNRLLLLTKYYLERDGSNLRNLEQLLGLKHTFMVEKLVRQAQNHKFDDLFAMHQKLYDSDKMIKTGMLDERTAVESFLLS